MIPLMPRTRRFGRSTRPAGAGSCSPGQLDEHRLQGLAAGRSPPPGRGRCREAPGSARSLASPPPASEPRAARPRRAWRPRRLEDRGGRAPPRRRCRNARTGARPDWSIAWVSPSATIRPAWRIATRLAELLDLGQHVARQEDRDAVAGERRDEFRMSTTPFGSRPLAGSSRITRSGRSSSAAAMPSRCRMPVEKRPALRLRGLGRGRPGRGPPGPAVRRRDSGIPRRWPTSRMLSVADRYG